MERMQGMGPYHVRVLRILKFKGYLTEPQIKQLSLLPQKDTSAVLNQLIHMGYINHVQVEQPKSKQRGSTLSSVAQSSNQIQQLMYSVNKTQIRQDIACRVAGAILNILSRDGELGSMVEITREFNWVVF